jgi:predicted nucleic acid-binding protein
VRVLFDTDVVLDVMLDRKPFAEVTAQLFSLVEAAEIAGFLSATTVTTIHYLATKTIGADQAQREIRKLLVLFEIAPVSRAVLASALELKFTDFEDAVLHEAARHAGVQAIVTRDIDGFKQAAVPTYSPRELSKMLEALKSPPKQG